MKLDKRWMLTAAALILTMALAGCTRNVGALENTAAPDLTAMPQGTSSLTGDEPFSGMGPSADNTAGVAAGDNNGANTGAAPGSSLMGGPMDWTKDFDRVESRLRMISEIESATVVVDDGVALVGVVFDGAYQGEMTQRIRDMVAGEVQAADPEVDTVGVTADPDDVKKIQDMAQTVHAGEVLDDLADKIKAIINNVTTMK